MKKGALIIDGEAPESDDGEFPLMFLYCLYCMQHYIPIIDTESTMSPTMHRPIAPITGSGDTSTPEMSIANSILHQKLCNYNSTISQTSI